MDVEKQVLIIWSAINGYTDDIPVENVRKFEAELLKFVENSHPGVLQKLREKKAVDDDIKSDLQTVVKDFKGNWAEQAKSAGA